MKKHISIALLFAVAAGLALTKHAPAAIIYSTPGATYSQNFDSLPNTPQNTNLQSPAPGKKWIDDTATPPGSDFSIVGWYLWHPTTQTGEGGTNNHQRMRIGAGTANTGAFMSFGASGSTERALGMVSSNTMADLGATDGNSYYGARITNNTGRRLTSFTLSYNGEQWRDGGAAVPTAQSITFDYKVAAATIQDASGFNDVPALNFTSPTFTNTGGGAGLDGNDANPVPLPVNKLAIGSVTVPVYYWQPGTDLWIRWTDLNDAGNDHGLGIDDLSFSADIPEPTSVVLFVLGLIGTCVLRRVR